MRSILISGTIMLMASAAAPAVAAGPIVATKSGPIQGASTSGVDSFKGIPFAAPPVGALRWRAPQPAAAWSSTRPAVSFGADCMQAPFGPDDAPPTTTPSEDCLFVNVWRPAGRSPGRTLPVMVWIYGGGFLIGGTSPRVYDGSAFARDGVVFVSFNYRLGRFGFFGFPALTDADADGGLLGNYALMDQIAALKWVRANIAAFGGDPAQVTIFGESAGGVAVHTLLTSPLARGLFARAIIESGGGRTNLIGPRPLSQDRPDTPSAETIGVNFARANGINGTDAAALAQLRALPGAAVLGGMTLGSPGEDTTYAGPVLDGKLLVEPAETAYAARREAQVPLIVGANSGDLGSAPGDSKEALFASFGANAAAARAAYDPDGTAPFDRVHAQAAMDHSMLEPARNTARAFAAAGLPAYEYRFSYTASPRRPTSPWGAPHASELPFVFDTVTARYGGAATAQDQAVARLMHRAWVNFALAGDPNGGGVTGWPRYDAGKDVIMDFTADGRAVAKPDPFKARLDAAEAVVGKP